MSKQTIEIIVLNGHTMGYRLKGRTSSINILQALVHKGAPSYRSDGMFYPNATDIVRPANAKDFEEFGISIDGYRDDPRYKFDRG